MRHDASDQEMREAVEMAGKNTAVHRVLAISGIRAHDLLDPVPAIEADWTPKRQEAFLRFARKNVRGLKASVSRHIDMFVG